MRRFSFRTGFTLFLAAPLLFAGPVQATLGEPAASVAADRRALGGLMGAKTTQKNYQIEEIKTDAATVREYVSPDGIVFAIAWNGLIHPDLTKLLGTYSGEYNQALKKVPRKPGRRSLQVKSDRVVVEKWGHMRNLQGRAYAPALLPPGVNTNELN
jgi:hypothetical protein